MCENCKTNNTSKVVDDAKLIAEVKADERLMEKVNLLRDAIDVSVPTLTNDEKSKVAYLFGTLLFTTVESVDKHGDFMTALGYMSVDILLAMAETVVAAGLIYENQDETASDEPAKDE